LVAPRVRERVLQSIRTPLTPKSRPWCLITAADRDVVPGMRAFVNVALKSRTFVALD